MSDVQPVQLPAVWIGLDELPIQMCSQFLAQIGAPNEILLAFGQAAPPLTVGTAEEQQLQLRATPFVPIRALGRFSLTAHRLAELLEGLQQLLEAHNANFPGVAQ